MRRRYAALLSCLLTAACGGGGGEATSPGGGGGGGGGGTPAAVATVTLGGAPTGSLTVGSTVTLTATPRDAQGNALTGRTVSWSSSAPSVATVDGGGAVRGVAAGTTQITATVESRTASVAITVAAPVPASVDLTWSSSYLVVGDTMRVAARVLDAGGQQIAGGASPTFATTGGAVAVTPAGDVTAVAPGTATVTATLGTLTRSATLTVVAGAGQRIASMSVIDSAVIEGMKRLGIPGAQVSVTRDDRLVFARAYGWADTAAKRAATLQTTFRVGSTSKPLTAVATMKLVQDGRLGLDDKVFTVLANVTPIAGRTEDARLADLTVRQLLAHTQGFNPNREVDDSTWRYVSRDRIFDYVQLSRLGRSTRFVANPGTQHAYNNFGYILLGRLIERASGKSYEAYVREAILDPAGVPAAMRLGRTPLNLRDPLEATCYDNMAPATSVYGTGKLCDVAPEQEYAEASGQWVASATDMVRWMTIVNGVAGRADILSAASITAMTTRPTANSYALGWQVVPSGTGTDWSHTGAQRGGDGFVLRRADGVGLAVVTNLTRNLAPAGQELDVAVRTALGRVTTWPAGTAF